MRHHHRIASLAAMAKEVGAYPLSSDDSDATDPMALPSKKDYSASGVTIAPRSDSDYFAMVKVKVVGPISQALSGCTYTYRDPRSEADGASYSRTLHNRARPPSHPRPL